MTYSADMEIKMSKARGKISEALRKARPALMIGNTLSEDPRIVRAAMEAGVTLFEMNHASGALRMGLNGYTRMCDAELVRYQTDLGMMLETIRALRRVNGDSFFLTVAVPGLFTEVVPVPFTDDMALALSEAGADCLHVHKNGLDDLKQIVSIAKRNGLLVEAYITHPASQDAQLRFSEESPSIEFLGIEAETPEDAARVGKQMEEMGVDLIGFVTGITYSVNAGQIPALSLEKLRALSEAVSVPVVVEGGLNLSNYQAVGQAASILMISTGIEHLLWRKLKEIIKSYDIWL